MPISLFQIIAFAFTVCILPGPANILSASCGQKNGFINSLRFITGAAVGYGCLAFIIGVGHLELIQEFNLFVLIIRYCSCAYLIFLALRVITFDGKIAFLNSRENSLSEGLMVQVLNPKCWSSAILGSSSFVSSRESLMVFVFVMIIVGWIGKAIWAYAGNQISKALLNQRHQIMFNWTLGFSLVTAVFYVYCYD